MFQSIGFVTDVLGRTRRTDYMWSTENGADCNAYNCPFCASAVADSDGCQNPWCTANPLMPIDAAREIVRKAEERAREEAERQRNHELAMQRIAEDNDRRIREYQDFIMRVRAKRGCERCSNQYRDKIIRHRKSCPKAAA